MSRDWTPSELNRVDKYTYRTSGRYLHDDVISLQADDGSEVVISYHKYPEVVLRYPHLGFLSDNFAENYMNEYSQTKEGRHICDVLEQELTLLTEDKHTCEGEMVFLQKWYEGKLCSNFYYNEDNEANFTEEIRNLIARYRTDTKEKEECLEER